LSEEEEGKIPFTAGDLSDFKGNPVWKVMTEQLEDRYEGCIEALRKLNHPKAIEANLVRALLDSPEDFAMYLETQEEEKNA